MHRQLLLPGSLVSIPPRKELSHLISGLREKDQGLLRVDVDGNAVRDDGIFVKRDEILTSAGAERLVHALLVQQRLRVLRYVPSLSDCWSCVPLPWGAARRIVNHAIGNKGACAVANLIELSNRIVLVDISKNGVTAEGIIRVAQAVAVNQSLLSLEWVIRCCFVLL
jgi:hypothetical protein